MAMIECPECEKQVSEKAAQCPNCAFPIAVNSNTATVNPSVTQTVELTGKKLKTQIVLSVLMVLSCLVIAIAGSSGGSSGATTIGGFGMAIGVTWFIVTRIRIWWNHK